MNSRTTKYRLQGIGNSNPYKWIKLGLISIATCLVIMSCENDIEKIKKFASNEEPHPLSAEGYELIHFDSTVVRYKIKTPEMIVHGNQNEKEDYTEFPKGVKITQYDSRMNIISDITSQYAKYFNKSDRWEAKNNVVAVNQKGDTLKTEFLVWDKKKGKIYSDQFVKIIQKDQITTGTSFESNQDFSEYTFKNLKGQMYVDVKDK